MKTRTAIIIFSLAFIIQTTLLRYIAIDHTAPNLLLCLVIVFSFMYNEPFGILFSVIFGLLWDINFGIYMGVSAIGLLVVAMAMVLFRKPFNRESFLLALLGGVIGSILYSCIYLGAYKLLGLPHSIYYLLKPQLYMIMYNVAIVMILHLILRQGIIRNKKREFYSSGYHMIGRFQTRRKKWAG